MRSSKRILVLDVGGQHVKMRLGKARSIRKFDSGMTLTAKKMVAEVEAATADWRYDAVSLGYPGVVVNGKPAIEPRNLGAGWVKFSYDKAFGKPVRIINDAAMQAMGSYKGGRMLFLGLGTGLGSALIIDGVIAPTELAHLPYKCNRSFEEYVGERGRKRLGGKKWRKAVDDVVERLRAALEVEYVVIGGGNACRLKRLPNNTYLGANSDAFIGGQRLWEPRRH